MLRCHHPMKCSRYLLCGAAIFFFCVSHAAVANAFPPASGWQSAAPEAQGMRSQLLAGMLEHIHNKSLHIDSVSIVRNGKMVLDAYVWPFSKGQKHIIHSCTKSIMSALIGIAIDKGFIKGVDQPVLSFFPEKTFADVDDRKKAITLENLLTMASGLKCRDSYLYRWKGLMEMRYSRDWVQHVLDLPMSEPPGDKFEYCNGVSHLLSAILQNATDMRTLAFAERYLFEPLGISDKRWAASPQGVDIGYGEMWLTPHDMAKFGWLYLKKGKWGDKQIVPSSWVDASTQGHVDATIFDRYGYQWWIDSAGYYAAVGFKGQRIFVVPQKNLVAVFTGDLIGNDSLYSRKLLDLYILPSVESAEPLPPDPAGLARLNEITAILSKAPDGYVWTSKAEGIARDGVFERTRAPAFRFAYPLGSRKSALEGPNQIMRMKTPGDSYFAAYVGQVPVGVALADFGPTVFAEWLKQAGTGIKVISNAEITLKCGTNAYQTKISWRFGSKMPIQTHLVCAYKEDRYIFVCAHTWRRSDAVEWIVNSLTFK